MIVLIDNGMALIFDRFCCEFYAFLCAVLGIAGATFFIPYETPADCVKQSEGAAKNFYFNTVQLKCAECQQSSSAQVVTADGAFGFKLVFTTIRMTGNLQKLLQYIKKALKLTGVITDRLV